VERLITFVAAADTSRRVIEGIAVPYDEPAPVGFATYSFEPGSVVEARARTPYLLGHDTNRPVGVVEQLVDTPFGAAVRVRIDKTPDGDLALAQAKSGSRAGLSVGFEILDSTDDDADVIRVHKAAVYELSQVAVPAFEGAAIERVAAAMHLAEEPEPEPADPHALPEDAGRGLDDDTDAEPAELDDDDPDEEEEETMEASDIPAGRWSDTPADRAPVIRAERRRDVELSAGEFVHVLIRAQHGDTEARRYMQAALVESISTDVSGLLPPTYERTVIGGKTEPRPLYETFRSRPLPGVGLQVNKPHWVTPPVGAWAANVDADATSSKVTVDIQSATVQRWDWATAIPWVVVQRSDPSVIDEVYAQAVESFYLGVEQKIGGEILAAAPATATTLGAAVAEFFVACSRTPDVIIVAPNVWGTLADAKELDMSAAQGDVSAAGSALVSSFGGLPVIVSGTLAAGNAILATRRAVDARATEPVRLTANAIGALNVEFAVVGEGLFDTDYPAELLKVGTVTLPAAAGTAAKAK